MRKRKGRSEKPETLKSKEKGGEGEGDEKMGKEEKGFFACYLLTSLGPRHKGHTYIGFTVNPRRRVRQHNGEIRSGAWRTKSKRPWEMVLCIYGFATNVSALQFEWAWQHPTESLAVRQAAATFKSFSGIANKIKLAYTMLNLPAWQSLNLTVNYFSTKYTNHSAGCPSLPEHMRVQVRPMDELPCYTERGESLYEDEDGCDDGEEYNEASIAGGTVRETYTDANFHISADYSCGTDKSSYNYDEASCTSETVQETDIDATFHNTEDYPRSIDGALYEQCGWLEEFGKAEPTNSFTPGEDHGQPISFIKSLVRTTSPVVPRFSTGGIAEDIDMVKLIKDNSIIELGWPRSKQLTTVVDADKHQQPWPRDKQFATSVATDIDQRPTHSCNVSYEVEVIDLLTPPSDCKIMSCRKKRSLSSIHPEIIDLT